MTKLIDKVKALIPLKLKRIIVNYYLKKKLRRGLSSLKRNRHNIQDHIIHDIIVGWSNTGWSADINYIKAILGEIKDSNINILECGSGISTIIMAMVNPNCQITCLEHTEAWSKKVKAYLDKYKLYNVDILSTPIKSYGSYDWYDTYPLNKNIKFDLIICDGPPSSTRGGRYGLLPLMKDQFNKNAVILLDDTVREDERMVIEKWTNEFNEIEKVVPQNPYSIIYLRS